MNSSLLIWTNSHCVTVYGYSSQYLFISEFRESVHYDTKHNVEANGGDNDEEGDVKEESVPSNIRTFTITSTIYIKLLQVKMN